MIVVSAQSTAQMSSSVPERLDLGPSEPLTITTRNGSHDFSVEIADTPAEQTRGMMFREEMGEDTGMLFEFAAPRVSSIWMRNTPLPLDILFVRANGQILKIEHMAQPYSERSMSSGGVVSAVLEIQGGRAQTLGIAPGDTLVHEFFGNTEKTSEN